jgi:hypothetical protein
MIDYGPWRIASGYRSQSGVWLWRVIRCEIESPNRFEEAVGQAGKLLLLRSAASAHRRAAKLNGEAA